MHSKRIASANNVELSERLEVSTPY